MYPVAGRYRDELLLLCRCIGVVGRARGRGRVDLLVDLDGWLVILNYCLLRGPQMRVYLPIVFNIFAWRGRSRSAPFILPHCCVGPSSLVPHCCSGLCFGRRLLIVRAITFLFAALNLGEGWMFLMVDLLVGCR